MRATDLSSGVGAAIRRATERINAGEARGAIADDLATALQGSTARDNEPEVLAAARDLLRDLRAAVEIEHQGKSRAADASLDDLTAALIDCKLPIDVLTGTGRGAPDPLTHKFTGYWQQLTVSAEHEQMDPAFRLFKRGREALPVLVDLIDDTVTTRVVLGAGKEVLIPTLARRQDVAISIIEAITNCSFNRRMRAAGNMYGGPLTPLIAMDEASRGQIIAAVREWWMNTQTLAPAEALAWRIDHAPVEERLEMINVLVNMGERERAIGNLRTLFEEAGPPHIRSLAAQALLQMGDDRPLVRLRELVARESPPDTTVLGLLAQHGRREEFELLLKLTAEDLEAHPNDRAATAEAILSALSQANNVMAVPVLVEGLRCTSNAGFRSMVNGATQSFSSADLAAERIQILTGIDFGYRADGQPAARSAAQQRIREWWQSEGRGQFSLSAGDARRRGGIR
ncbi:MAG TPA: hypothetical protein VGM03_23490 [Phycisphaerae bacterium]